VSDAVEYYQSEGSTDGISWQPIGLPIYPPVSNPVSATDTVTGLPYRRVRCHTQNGVDFYSSTVKLN
jgi:hypothetical protein